MAGGPVTILCIATYRKGDEFLSECNRQGCRVLLVTDEKLKESDWPRDAVDEFFYVRRDMPEEDIRKGAAFLGRRERLDRIVALDDFDVETAAMLREYLHVPGMGWTNLFPSSLQSVYQRVGATFPVLNVLEQFVLSHLVFPSCDGSST